MILKAVIVVGYMLVAGIVYVSGHAAGYTASSSGETERVEALELKHEADLREWWSITTLIPKEVIIECKILN